MEIEVDPQPLSALNIETVPVIIAVAGHRLDRSIRRQRWLLLAVSFGSWTSGR